MTTQAISVLLWILGLLAVGFGAGITAGLWLCRRWRRQREKEGHI